MRSRLPLAALLLAFAAPSRAQECKTGQFTVEVLSKKCDQSIFLLQSSQPCLEHLTGVVGDCKKRYQQALTEEAGLLRQPEGPERARALAITKKKIDEAEQVFREASAASDEAETPGGIYTKGGVAQAFFLVQTFQIPGQVGKPRSNLRELAFTSMLEAQARSQDVDISDSAVGVGPTFAPETKTRIVAVANGALATQEKKKDPDPQVVAAAGDLALKAGDQKAVEKAVGIMIDRIPRDSRGPELAARGALLAGDSAKAEAWAKKALELDPNNKKAADALAFAKADLAKARLKKPVVGNFEEARERDLDRGLAAAAEPAARAPGAAPGAPGVSADPVPRVLNGLLRRGYEKMNLGDLAGALDDVSTYLDSHPDDAEARLVRAEVLLQLGKPDAALADIDLALAKSPEDPRALRARAAALLELGRHDEALKAIEKALSIEPASGIGHLTRAKILEKLGRVDEALAEYRSAAQLDPSLTPVVDAALRRLGAAPASAPKAVERGLLRGGLITVSLSLVLLGLIGGAVARTRRARTAAPAGTSPEKTLGKGDLIGGQYRITRELGRGGMGVVFEAVDERLNRPVAVKQLQGDFRASAEDAARFLQEARLVAQLKHPNVAQIHAAVEDGGLFLVFELVEGRPLDALLGAGVTPEQARGIVAHVCSALTAAHGRRIIHRDLKPANLMITGDGVVKVMDFGIAHQASGADFTKTSASGTPPYMAPEQAMGSVSSSSDLYALGVMAYELLTGARPFDGPDYLGPKLDGRFVPPTQRRPGLPKALDAFFASALAPDPTKRPVDAAAFAAAFSACWP